MLVPSVNGSRTATAVLEGDEDDAWSTAGSIGVADHDHADDDGSWAAAQDGGPGRIVRIKDHPADPISVDQALLQMELVGHDFYLFTDADTKLASVVYRRRGFDYGLLRLT